MRQDANDLSPPLHQHHREQREDNPHHPNQPHQRDKAQRQADLHARVPPYKGCQAAMPTREITALDGPMTP